MARSISGIFSCFSHTKQVWIIFIQWHRTVIIKSLCGEHLRKLSLMPRTFLKFGALILKPNFYLVFIQAQVLKKKYKYILCLSWCLLGCLNPINVKPDEPIRHKFSVGPHVAPGKIFEWSKFLKFASIKFRTLLNF